MWGQILYRMCWHSVWWEFVSYSCSECWLHALLRFSVNHPHTSCKSRGKSWLELGANKVCNRSIETPFDRLFRDDTKRCMPIELAVKLPEITTQDRCGFHTHSERDDVASRPKVALVRPNNESPAPPPQRSTRWRVTKRCKTKTNIEYTACMVRPSELREYRRICESSCFDFVSTLRPGACNWKHARGNHTQTHLVEI